MSMNTKKANEFADRIEKYNASAASYIHELSDEVDKLRLELSRRHRIDTDTIVCYQKEVHRLKLEVDRLREETDLLRQASLDWKAAAERGWKREDARHEDE